MRRNSWFALMPALLLAASVHAQHYNRSVSPDDIMLLPREEAIGTYDLGVAIRFHNGSNATVDLTTTVNISINGVLVASDVIDMVMGPWVTTCSGFSCPSPCGTQSLGHPFYSIVRQCVMLTNVNGCVCDSVAMPPHLNGLTLTAMDNILVEIGPGGAGVTNDNPNDNSAQRTVIPPCIWPLAGYTSERFSALPNNRMQLMAYYDGNGAAELDVHLVNPATQQCCVYTVSGIANSPLTIQEFDLSGYVPTGKFVVRNVVPNGAVDGVAFSLYWRDATGARWRLQSRAPSTATASPNFVGMWPYSWTEATWDGLMPQLAGATVDDQMRRRQAQVNLSGAQVLGNGTWGIPTGRQPGDTNGDGCVNLTDLSNILAAFGLCCP